MKQVRVVLACIAACIAVIALAGCGGDDVEVSAREAAIVFGQDHSSFTVKSLKQTAEGWGLSAENLSAAAEKLHDVWEHVADVLEEANEDIEPVRGILISTACDTVQDGNYSETAIQQSLQSNARSSLEPVTQQMRETAATLVSSMEQDIQANGSAAKAEIALGCAAYSVRG